MPTLYTYLYTSYQCFVGDLEKVKENGSTNRTSYQPPPLASLPGHSYSRAAAISAILHSSVHLGHTTTQPQCEDTPPTSNDIPSHVVKHQERTISQRVHRNKSSLPAGDLNVEHVKERLSHSTTRSSLTVVS